VGNDARRNERSSVSSSRRSILAGNTVFIASATGDARVANATGEAYKYP
jgi:hypothetical protein